MSAGLAIFLFGLGLIAAAVFFIPKRINDFFNDHRWLLPAVAFLLMVGVVVEAQRLVSTINDDEVSSCERANDARVASIEEKEDDIRYSLEPALKLWEGAVEAQGIDPETPPAVVRLFNDFLLKLRRGILTKERGIESAIEAQADVAIHPRAKRPPERAIVDCSRAFGNP